MDQSLPAAVTGKPKIFGFPGLSCLLQLERFSTWQQTPLTNVSYPELVLRFLFFGVFFKVN